MKSLAIILCLSSLLWCGAAFADEPLVCFPDSEARQMLVPLEQGATEKAQIDALNQQVSALQAENVALKQQNDLLKQNSDLLKENAAQYKELLQVQRDSYESIIKANKPNPVKEFFDRLGFVGIGVMLGIIAIAL
jgi:regulator of replication initiation timing